MVPAKVLPEGMGVALVDVGTEVLMVPPLVIVAVPDKTYEAVISKVPPEVVVKVPVFTTIAAPAVWIPLVLLRVKLL